MLVWERVNRRAALTGYAGGSVHRPTAATGSARRGRESDIPMRETSPRGWHRWRVAVVKSAPAATTFDHMSRLSTPVAAPEPATVGAGVASAHAEEPGPDGIRHELVARIRQQIADGTYDTEEKWLLAEEALLRRLEGCA